ncbi:protein PAIR1-like [Musa acuminata AAA Group]|uniref:protein PAIR1-like n=1 Tax=Musa acuminata AAA Group TaxID=214697 RepID=UPI0031D53C62
MKLRINKACDLGSISVLPPRRSGGMSSGGDGLGRSQASQIRSQSQQSFSQGISLSQLSQSSFEEPLVNDQRFGSQEKDNSLRKISSLAPIALTREESQLQLTRASSNVMHRWNAASMSDNRFQVSEELEHKLRHIESSINRVGMILDSVQSDVMQVNRAAKELSLEVEGIRQKVSLLENSMQQMVKWEDDIKAFIGGSLTSISDQLIKISSSGKVNEIASAVATLQEQMFSRLARLECEVCRFFSEKEVRESGIKSSNNQHSVKFQSPMVRESGIKSSNNQHSVKFQSPMSGNYMDIKESLEGNIEEKKVSAAPLMSNKQRSPPFKKEGKLESFKSKLTEPKHTVKHKHIIPHTKQEEFVRVIVDLDEESDGGISCLIVNKGTGLTRV